MIFADYMSAQNREAWRYEQPTKGTLQYVEEGERVTCARVSLIATGFVPNRGIIDRRQW